MNIRIDRYLARKMMRKRGALTPIQGMRAVLERRYATRNERQKLARLKLR